MELTRFERADVFYQRVAPFLLEHEAEHNLILGLCVDIEKHPERYPDQPYFAVVTEGDQVQFAALMTPPHNLTVSLCGAPRAVALLVADVARFSPLPPGVSGSTEASGMFATTWQDGGHGTAHKHMALRIYKLTQVQPVASVPGSMRRATSADAPLLTEWFAGFEQDALDIAAPQISPERVAAWITSDVRAMFLWQIDDEPVSMAGYSGPTPNSMRINAVYTPPVYRRKGYASALVAALSQHMLDSGRQFCTLFTDLANPTSNHIYQKIGYEPVIDVDEWRFAEGKS